MKHFSGDSLKIERLENGFVVAGLDYTRTKRRVCADLRDLLETVRLTFRRLGEEKLKIVVEDDGAELLANTVEQLHRTQAERDALRAEIERVASPTRESNGLRFSDLREANRRRLPGFKDAHGRPAHAEPDGSDWSPNDWYTAASGELGELGNLLKKVRRGDLDLDEAMPDIRHEIADAVCYLDLLAHRLDIDLGEAVIEKFNIVSERVGSDVRLGE